MRDILLIFIMLLAWVLSAEALWMYTPLPQDSELIISLENKVESIYQSSPEKIESIWEKLSRSLPAFSEDTQIGYILWELQIIIENRIKMWKKSQERSNEMLGILAGQF